MDEKRKNPKRYTGVKSKVGGNLKVQKQRSLRKSGSPNKDELNSSMNSSKMSASLNKSLDVA